MYLRTLEPASEGSFTSKDPIFPWSGANPFIADNNNPLSFVDPTGLSSVIYNRGNGTVTLVDHNGNVIGVYPAGNNVVGGATSPLQTGESYSFSHFKPHTADPNGPFGSNGNFVFDVPGHTGVGVHSGRTNRGGPLAKTNGCVRTTDQGTQTIFETIIFDPLTGITVIDDPLAGIIP